MAWGRFCRVDLSPMTNIDSPIEIFPRSPRAAFVKAVIIKPQSTYSWTGPARSNLDGSNSMRGRFSLVSLVLGLFANPAFPQNAVPLSTGKLITPLGTQTEVGSFPANMVLTPDGRHVIVANTGFYQFISVLSATNGKLISRIEVGKPDDKKKEGIYYGLAFAGSSGEIQSVILPDNVHHTLYVSRGAEDKVAIYTVSGAGKIVDTGRRLDNPGSIGGKGVANIVAGVATSRGAKLIYAVNNNTTTDSGLKGSLSVIDVERNSVLRKVDVAGFPFGVAALTAGAFADRKVYVSSERDGLVSVVDPVEGKLLKSIRTGENALTVLLDRAQHRLFVANSGSDTVSIIDTGRDRVTRTILLRPDDVRGLPGATPTGMALSPDEQHLFVTLSDMNAVAVVDLPTGRLAGYIPAGWYPTSCVVTPDGKRLFVANAKGIARRNPNDKSVRGRGHYIQGVIEGTVSVIPIPNGTTLRRYTLQTLANNRIAEANRTDFHNPGIEHAIYIIKENRTYDQVLGDMKKGNGDLSQALFGRKVTPNQHALAERFVLLDNFFVCAEVSADGWNWSTSGMANEYTSRNAPYNYSGRGKRYDFEGQNNGVPINLLGLPDVGRAPGGYIWELVAKAGLSLRNYGCFLNDVDPKTRVKEGPLANVVDNTPNQKALVGRTNVDFRQFDLSYADSDAWIAHNAPFPKQMKTYGSHRSPSRFAEWKREFDEYVKDGTLPRFSILRFPNDHTNGTSPGFASPRAAVADNDYAVGQLVEAVSNSPYWKNTAIFILEDDAQDGNDHVDAHRSTCFVISPFVKRATVDSRFYNTDSLLRTMELILGLPPMNQYDAIATPFRFFADTANNDEAYAAILPERSIVAEVNKATAYKARQSARFSITKADSAPDDLMSDIVWRSVKGRNIPMPAPRYGLRMQPANTDRSKRDHD